MPSFPMQETISRLRQRIERANSLSQEEQNTLLELIEQLESEAAELDAENTAPLRQAIAATEGSCSEDKNENMLESLQTAMQEIEASHPKTAETLARIGNILGRMGI